MKYLQWFMMWFSVVWACLSFFKLSYVSHMGTGVLYLIQAMMWYVIASRNDK